VRQGVLRALDGPIALAAKEACESLTLYSAGPGQGAAFTLELPLQSSGGVHG
jgi:hypothetical protein